MADHFKKIKSAINESIEVKNRVLEHCAEDIEKTGLELANALKKGNKILFCGNGGSAADSQHLAAELVIRFRSSIERRALPAIALTVDPSLMTAGGNDYGFENVFARATEAYGKKGDILVGISTSGNSENVMRAADKASELDMKVIGLLGNDGGKIKGACDSSVIIPGKITARIQESHILVGHIWCEIIEEELFPELF
ncbi:MAG: SIS domain-containing protein [Candidatus Kapaibacterium sp.]